MEDERWRETVQEIGEYGKPKRVTREDRLVSLEERVVRGDLEVREWIRYLEERMNHAPDKAEFNLILGRISDMNKKLETVEHEIGEIRVLISRLGIRLASLEVKYEDLDDRLEQLETSRGGRE